MMVGLPVRGVAPPNIIMPLTGLDNDGGVACERRCPSL